MKLYRGYKKRPYIYTEKLQKEFLELEEKLREGPEKEILTATLHRMGIDAMDRHFDLRKIGGPQFFTNMESLARDFAGQDGFVMIIDVPDEVADEHYQGEEVMHPGAEMVFNSNYVFMGEEIAEHLADWNVDLIEMERESHEVQAEASPHRDPNQTIRGNEDLTESDHEAINQFRQHFKNR